MRTEGRPSASAVASATGVVSISCAEARSTAILNWMKGSGLDINVIAGSRATGDYIALDSLSDATSALVVLRENQRRRGTIARDD